MDILKLEIVCTFWPSKGCRVSWVFRNCWCGILFLSFFFRYFFFLCKLILFHVRTKKKKRTMVVPVGVLRHSILCTLSAHRDHFFWFLVGVSEQSWMYRTHLIFWWSLWNLTYSFVFLFLLWIVDFKMKICYSLIAYYMDFMVHYPFYIDVLVYLDLSLVRFVSSYFFFIFLFPSI